MKSRNFPAWIFDFKRRREFNDDVRFYYTTGTIIYFQLFWMVRKYELYWSLLCTSIIFDRVRTIWLLLFLELDLFVTFISDGAYDALFILWML